MNGGGVTQRTPGGRGDAPAALRRATRIAKPPAPRFAQPNMTPENFDDMLLWLDPDPDHTGVPCRERGAEKYEKIRHRIIKVYRNRGCCRAEEIADVAISRVCPKVPRLRLTYKGDPALYFYGVARKVYLEFLAQDARPRPAPGAAHDPEEVERRHACLEHCLARLKPEHRELILCFYLGEKRAKIDNRKTLAARLSIDTRALSLRAMRIRRELYECLAACLGDELPKVNRGGGQ